MIFRILCLMTIFVSLQADSIKIGMSYDRTGIDSMIGIPLESGIRTYFNKINATGGIDGKKIELIALNDNYDPKITLENARKLIDQDHVLALIGNTGTPSALALLPILKEKKIVLFGPHTGAEISEKYIFIFRPTYNEEIDIAIKDLMADGIKPSEIGFVIQDNFYGDMIYKRSINALKEYGYSDPETLPHVHFKENADSIKKAIDDLLEQSKNGNLKIIIVGALQNATAQFIKIANRLDAFSKMRFFAPSVSIASFYSLVNKDEPANIRNGSILSYFILPFDSDLEDVRTFFDDMKQYAPNDPVVPETMEGYFTAKLFVMGLKKAAAENKLTREGIVGVLESLDNVDLGIGVKITLSTSDHHALHNFWQVINNDDRFKVTPWKQSR